MDREYAATNQIASAAEYGAKHLDGSRSGGQPAGAFPSPQRLTDACGQRVDVILNKLQVMTNRVGDHVGYYGGPSKPVMPADVNGQLPRLLNALEECDTLLNQISDQLDRL